METQTLYTISDDAAAQVLQSVLSQDQIIKLVTRLQEIINYGSGEVTIRIYHHRVKKIETAKLEEF